jgi:hypothetical protein
MLCFSFFNTASLESISKNIRSITLIGQTFVALTTILQVVLWSGPLRLLLCVLMHYCLLSVEPSCRTKDQSHKLGTKSPKLVSTQK